MGIVDAARAAQRAARASHGVDVLYRRGDLSVQVKATRGKSDVAVDSQYGAILINRVRDWLIDADALVLGGEQVEPERGDIIEVPEGNTVWRYEVEEIPTGEWFRYSGPGRETLRIHTSFDGEA